MSNYPVKRYPLVGACGLDCGLCPRYHTRGESKCPGCAGADFEEKHPACGFITCCVKEKHFETCAECPDQTSCERVRRLLESAEKWDSFISHRPLKANFEFIRQHGIDEFTLREKDRMEFLGYLLAHFDEGRSKAFYCTACQLLPLEYLQAALAEVEKETGAGSDIKEKSRRMRPAISRLADAAGIELKLRK